ncbi:MAG: hypothetical protein HY677_03395 [Chloroflexi bacterium]|nr:hypothetical protein [Chloroflexota bacterium]
MRKNVTKAKIKAGETVYGVFCNLYSPAAVEVLGVLGFDFVIIDAEHGPMDVRACEEMIRAADATGVTPIVRVAVSLQQNILRHLDIGALGVQMPMINTKAEAEAVVASVKYPPVGKRGLAAVRANDYGFSGSLGDYVKMANQETLVITHVETMEAVANLPAMLEVEEIDVIFIGPTDLSSSMGYPGQRQHPDVLAMIERLGKQIRAGGKAAGTIASDPMGIAWAKEKGFQYLATGITTLLGQAGRDYLKASRGS